jgi:hypothetical protein
VDGAAPPPGAALGLGLGVVGAAAVLVTNAASLGAETTTRLRHPPPRAVVSQVWLWPGEGVEALAAALEAHTAGRGGTVGATALAELSPRLMRGLVRSADAAALALRGWCTGGLDGLHAAADGAVAAPAALAWWAEGAGDATWGVTPWLATDLTPALAAALRLPRVATALAWAWEARSMPHRLVAALLNTADADPSNDALAVAGAVLYGVILPAEHRRWAFVADAIAGDGGSRLYDWLQCALLAARLVADWTRLLRVLALVRMRQVVAARAPSAAQRGWAAAAVAAATAGDTVLAPLARRWPALLVHLARVGEAGAAWEARGEDAVRGCLLADSPAPAGARPNALALRGGVPPRCGVCWAEFDEDAKLCVVEVGGVPCDAHVACARW